jgi:hypothetical protein
MGGDGINLHLSTKRIEAFCDRLAAQLNDHQRRLAALHSLQTFIATMAGPGDRAKVDQGLFASSRCAKSGGPARGWLAHRFC